MKLYYMTGACPLAPQILLEWLGTPYELENVDRSALKSPEFLALNPVGSVPVLADGALKLTQVPAIMEYLVEKQGDSALMGGTPEERAEVRRWLSFCNSDLHRTFSMLFSAPSYSDDAKVQEILTNKSAERVQFLFGVADKQLNGKDYIAGQRSVADPYLYTVMRWTKIKNVSLQGMPNLAAYYDRMDSDAGVRNALTKQGLA